MMVALQELWQGNEWDPRAGPSWHPQMTTSFTAYASFLHVATRRPFKTQTESWGCPYSASPRWPGHQPLSSLSVAAFCLITHDHLLLSPSCLLSLLSTLPGAPLQPNLIPPLGPNSIVTSPRKLLGPPAWVLSAPSLSPLPIMGRAPLGPGWFGAMAKPGLRSQGTCLPGPKLRQTLSHMPAYGGQPLGSGADSWVP